MAMSECDNEYCVCHETESADPRKLGARDLETRYRMLVSRIEDARHIAAELFELGYGIALGDVLGDLMKAAIVAHSERELAASEYGFTIKAGVGPGDWKGKQ